MKRLIILILSFAYLSVSAGVKINLFYCCGQLDKIYLFEQKELSDDCNGPKKGNCCDNKSAFLKIKGEQKKSSMPYFGFKLPFIEVRNHVAFLPSVSLGIKSSLSLLTENNLTPSPPRYILYCLYRI